ncbi:hypothetical protein HN928_03250, partial [bacterium]|nr:hypothetical protein [bacterium]
MWYSIKMKKIISVVQPRAGFIDLSDPDIKLDEILVRQYAEQLNSRAEVPFSICPSLANATIVPINFSDPTSLLYYDLPNYGIAAAQRTFSATRPKCALCGVLNGELDQGIQIIGLETSAGKTISCFPSNLPYLPQLFALPVKTHTPWDMDIHSALQIVLRTDQYYVAQNSTLGASVKEHSHFQVFTFPRKLPVEKAPTRVFGEKQIGENILTFATCDYPQSTLKVTIENAAQIEDEVFAVLENIIKAYKALDTNNHVSFIAK